MPSDLYHYADVDVRLRAVLHSLGLVALSFVPAVVGTVLIGAAFAALGLPLDTSDPVALVGLSLVQYVGFLLVAGAYLAYFDERDLVDWGVPSLRDLGWMVGGYVGLFVLAGLAGLVFQALGVQNAEHGLVTTGQGDPTLFLYMIPVTILFVGPAEELLFRGIVQRLFRRAYGVVPAIVVASALFGVVHVVALSGSSGTVAIAATLAVTGILGAILGTIYELSDNLVVPIVVHGLWNATTFASLYVRATMDVPVPA